MANAASVPLCKDRGGVPIVNTVNDDGGHTFTVLVSCAFPGPRDASAVLRAAEGLDRVDTAGGVDRGAAPVKD